MKSEYEEMRDALVLIDAHRSGRAGKREGALQPGLKYYVPFDWAPLLMFELCARVHEVRLEP